MVIVMYGHNGMSQLVKEDATHADLRAVLDRRKRQGYEAYYLTPFQVEVETDGLVDDNTGVLVLCARGRVAKHILGEC